MTLVLRYLPIAFSPRVDSHCYQRGIARGHGAVVILALMLVVTVFLAAATQHFAGCHPAAQVAHMAAAGHAAESNPVLVVHHRLLLLQGLSGGIAEGLGAAPLVGQRSHLWNWTEASLQSARRS